MCGLVAELAFPNATIAYFFSFLVDDFLFITVAVAAAVPAFKHYRWRALLLYIMSLGLAYLSIDIAKQIFLIPRPEGALIELLSYRFPSGHATMAAALATAIFMLYRTRLSRRGNIAVITAGILGVAAVGLVRILLVVHCPVDIAAGALLGSGIVIATFAAASLIPTKR